MRTKILLSIFNFFLLLFPMAVNAKVIYRTAYEDVPINSVDPFLSYYDSAPEAAPLNSMLRHFDVNQDGQVDFGYGWWTIPDINSYKTVNCPEGTITMRRILSHWVFRQMNGSNISFAVGYNTSSGRFLIGDYVDSKVTYEQMHNQNLVIGHCYKDRYPSPCNGQTLITTPQVLIEGYFGFRITINSRVHYGWLKKEGTTVVEIAYEDLPGVPIKIGSYNGLFDPIQNPNYNLIKGNVFADQNNNCIKDVTEKTIAGIPVQIKNTNYGAYTDANGNYEIMVPGTIATYEIEVDQNQYGGYIFNYSCGTISASFTGIKQTITKNIGIQPTNCVDLQVYVSSDRRRRCFRNKTAVNYLNRSITSASNVEVTVVMPEYVKAISSTPAWSQKKGDTLIYSVGMLNGLSYGTIIITDSVSCGNEEIRGLTQCTKAYISPGTYCKNGTTYTGSDIKLWGVCNNSVIKATLINKGQADMLDSLLYRILFDGVIVKEAKYKLNTDQSIELEIPAHGKSIRVEVDQEVSHPQLKIRSFNYEGCGNFTTEEISKGYAVWFPTHNGFAEDESCLTIIDSYDPNDKQVAPLNENNLISKNTDLVYTIRFQNTGTDVAYNICVLDSLSTNLDVTTIKMISASHPYSYSVSGGANNRIMWTFNNINLPAKSVNEPASHGYITFKISQLPDLADDTEIKNKAYIYFDYNSPIITNETYLKVGQPYVLKPLKFLGHTSSGSVCEKNNIQIELQTENAVDFQWLKDDQELSGENSSSLLISNASPDDGGVYKCRIHGLMETIYSTPVNISVNAYPDLQTEMTHQMCKNSTVDLSTLVSDSKATNGTLTFWKDKWMTEAVDDPASVGEEGWYYFEKTTLEGCSAMDSTQIVLQLCNGIIDGNLAGVEVFPNPASGVIYVDNQINLQNYELLDVYGKIIDKGKLMVGMNKINLPSTSGKFIILKIQIDEMIYMEKVIVE